MKLRMKTLFPIVFAWLLCALTFVQPAWASADEKSENTSAGLTPNGNMTLVDTITQTDTEEGYQQFLTVQTKDGAYFYIVIDRTGDEENVHFLNQVDVADLNALLEEETSGEEKEAVCFCRDKCVPGEVDEHCPVCAVDRTKCLGVERSADDEDTQTPQKKQNSFPLLLLLILGGGGGALYYFKFKKPKSGAGDKKDVDPDADYFGNDEDEEPELEDDTE